MNKSALKSGMRVVTRNGERYIVVGEILYDKEWDFISINNYNDDLKIHCSGSEKFDIMEIHDISKYGEPLREKFFNKDTVLWKRQELSEQDQKIIDAIKVVHPKYKWIARDESGTLCAYKSKPDKGNSSWFTSYDLTWLDDEHLQFIQWTDKEPYCIGD